MDQFARDHEARDVTRFDRSGGRIVWNRRPTLTDGTSVGAGSDDGGGPRCTPAPFGTWFALYDRDATEPRRQVYVLYLRDDARAHETNEFCEGTTGVRVLRYHVENVDHGSEILALEDGTFLLWQYEGNLILRFDRDFRQPVRVSPRVFVVDREVIQKILAGLLDDAGRPTYNFQAQLDAVHAYLLTLPPSGAP